MIRLVLVLLCVVLLAVLLLLMRHGWRNRMARQSGLPPLPEAPSEAGTPLLPPVTGLYVGTTFATSWQDRVVHGGLGARADSTAALYPTGLLLERVGAAPIFVPAGSMLGARLAPALAGKVTGAGGLLVVAWRLGEAELDTGFRADDKTVYPAWVRAINDEVAAV